jgi:hypothetical protein
VNRCAWLLLLLNACTIPVTENIEVPLPSCIEVVLQGDAGFKLGACRDAGVVADGGHE